MRRNIKLFLIAFIIGYLFSCSAKGSDVKIPEIPKEQRIELKNKILEATNLNYQIADLTRQRDQLAQEANQTIENLYKQFKLDKKDYQFDVNSISFISIKK